MIQMTSMYYLQLIDQKEWQIFKNWYIFHIAAGICFGNLEKDSLQQANKRKLEGQDHEKKSNVPDHDRGASSFI